MKLKLLLSAAALGVTAAGGLALASASAQDGVRAQSSSSERRCCIVEPGRWVRDPRSNWTPLACIALGEPGEYAPQGTSEAGACRADDWPPTTPPDPSPPPHDDGDDDDDEDGKPKEEVIGDPPPETEERPEPVITYGGERGPDDPRRHGGGSTSTSTSASASASAVAVAADSATSASTSDSAGEEERHDD